MQRHPTSSTLEFHARASSSAALIGSLLLLGASFTLLVLGPTLLGRLQGSAEAAPGGNYLIIAAASGIALGGGAAMIAVISRLVRDIEIRPYAGLAPVVAVFAGFVLWGLRAQLPLSGVTTEYVGVFALAVSVAGGGLIAQRGKATRAMGWALAFLAPLTLLGILWASSGQGNIDGALGSFPPPVRMFMSILAGAALVLALLGEVARVVRLRAPSMAAGADFLPLPRGRAGKSTLDGDRVLPTPKYGSAPMREPGSLREAMASTSDWREAPIPGTDAYLLQSQEFDQPKQYTPKVSVWDFEDEPLSLPSKHYALKAIFLLALILGGGGAGLYYGAILPNQQKERAVQAALQQRQTEIKAAEQREVEEKRATEAKAAAARLEELLNAPAANAAGTAAGAQAGGSAAEAPARAAKTSGAASPAGAAKVGAGKAAAAASSADVAAESSDGEQAPNLGGSSAIAPR